MITVRPSQTPSPSGIRLRAAWLASLASEDREGLTDLPLREVDDRYEHWRVLQPGEPDLHG